MERTRTALKKFFAVTALTVAAALVWPAVLSASTEPAAPPENISTALTKMDAFIRAALEKTRVPGVAVAVVYKDQVVFLRGYGVRKAGEPARVDADTVFEIASLSKPIGSTIVAALVGSGEVDWDDRIAQIDPEFALSDQAASQKVTIRDLFAHRSGLPTSSGDLLEDLGYSRPEILRRMRQIPLAGEFRTTYHYSNFGLTEAAIAASKKVGKPWEEIAEERLYSKIGMRSTSSRYSDYENNPNKAALHVLEDGVYRNRFVRDADAEAPAGGVSSNVRDLAQWLRLQLGDGTLDGHEVVARKALEETHKAQICAAVAGPVAAGQCPGGRYYGLGWNVGTDSEGKPRYSHSGAFLLGTGTSVYVEPGAQIGIVVLSNSTPVGLPEAVCLSFLDYVHYGVAKTDYLAVVAPIFGEMEKTTQNASPDYLELTPPANPAGSRPLPSYAGKYANSYYGTLEVGVERGQLILRLPPRGAYYELKHWGGNTFTYYFASESTGIGRRGLKFSADGKQVLVENLALEHDAVFSRVE